MTNGSAFDGFVAAMAAADPDGAIRWAAEMDVKKLSFGNSARIEGSLGERVRRAVIEQLIESDMGRAKTLAVEWKDDRVPRPLVAKALAESGVEVAVAWLDPNGEGIPGNLFAALVPALEKRSTAEVVSFFERHPSSDYAGSNSAAFLMSRSPDEAVQLADELAALPASAERDRMLAGALRIATTGDPETRLPRALELARSESIPAIALLMPQSLARDPAPLMDFAATLPVEDQEGFFRNVAMQATRENPRALGEVIAANLDTPSAELAVQHFVGAWAQDGLRAPSEWLRALPDGAPRDAGIGALVDQLHEIEPDSALVWAQSISDGDKRIDALERTLRPWVGIDAEGAVAAVAGLELSGAERQRLREFIANPDEPAQP